MTQDDRLAIWWTTEDDCKAMGEYLPLPDRSTCPEYLYGQYRSRTGRNGRGRLWTSSVEFPNITDIAWPDTYIAKWAGLHAGGIVIWRADIEHLVDLPGLITDLSLRRL